MQSNFVRNTPEDVLHKTAQSFKQNSYLLLLLPIDLLLFSSVNLICALFFLSNHCHTSDCSNHAQKTSFRIQPVPLLKKSLRPILIYSQSALISWNQLETLEVANRLVCPAFHAVELIAFQSIIWKARGIKESQVNNVPFSSFVLFILNFRLASTLSLFQERFCVAILHRMLA